MENRNCNTRLEAAFTGSQGWSPPRGGALPSVPVMAASVPPVSVDPPKLPLFSVVGQSCRFAHDSFGHFLSSNAQDFPHADALRIIGRRRSTALPR